MSEKNEAENTETMADALKSVETVHIGDTVKGEVLAVEDKQLVVGIEGTGVEGVVPLKELSTQPIDDIRSVAKVGDKLDLVVISTIGKDKENGQYLLSKRRLEAQKVWKEIQAKFDAGETITAPVTSVVKGGLVVNAGVRGFVPASMVEDHFVEDLSQYKGQELEFKIIEIEPSENRLILSHRAIVEAGKAEARKEIFAKIQPGDVVEGKVARLTNFGAFVDLGGVDGLVHVSEIAFDHVDKPSDVLKVGQDVKVKVLAVDPERDRISLSIKATLPQPWDDIDEKAPAGSTLTGTVKRLTSFGAFVEVFPGVEGLVHISQISHEHIATPQDVLKEGQEVQVKVLSVDPDQHRLALSIKALQERPEGMEEERPSRNNNSRGEGRPRRNNSRNEHTKIPAEYQQDDSGFSLGDILGDALKDAAKGAEDNDK
ncbi:MAG: 30S ribosomal protein S1 [Lactobacillus sp.]|jgi:small subunit ribosomal protein S1|uniref:30S ribosomal protein S1 n=1 Tax=Lacticaseibacillus suilingensis TaxID=2799577 RepID=A0ABW4BE66_9LACO|nr:MULTISPECIES: 30S ribosomal protein S1 [Lacticaseibacillus]MCI1893357.1 30S ribosomal protein S1 [Lactobacillus sp.]MCI1917455.1 30S ribosomal protein S1 [Lactobacillus sp.]MCI1940542.1 30S ribosomal protein S1 [Lactobacillus sp.]MCI1971053.1 30S ribosomal protein S1 [Lactobacillus sp.]MCI2017369.1 30S ribosomal protein S1 [Lactobacillus sp.]